MGRSTESGTALQRIRDAEDALEKAQVALDRARRGLSAVESVAEKAETVRRHPVRSGAVALLIVSALTLIIAVLKDRDDPVE